MVATMRGALGEVDVPPAIRRTFERLVTHSGGAPASAYTLLGYRGTVFTAHAAWPRVVLISDKMWLDGSSEDDVAAVLAHEIAHLQLKHSRIAGCRALKFVDTETWTIADAVQAVLRIAKTEPLVAQAWGAMLRRFEFEADALALDILRNGNFDPGALARLLTRLADEHVESDRTAAGHSATHPALRERIAALQAAAVRAANQKPANSFAHR